ncbi:hypothetical protein [Trichothermofontia sp.]
MLPTWKQLKQWCLYQELGISSVCIFGACLFIYWYSDRQIGSGDTVPNTLLAFNWLKNGILHFDNFRDSYFFDRGNVYFFVESPNGHLTSLYPIGPAIVAFPLYVLFFLWLEFKAIVKTWVLGYYVDPLKLTELVFDERRLTYEHLAAAILTAFSVVIFYLILRLKFNFFVALIGSFVFGIATNTWVTSSQGLWQHTIANLLILCIILSLFNANRILDANIQTRLLGVVGCFCGLLPGVRPTSALFASAVTVYVLYYYRWRSGFFFLGTLSCLLSVAWNLYYFQNPFGGYATEIESPYRWTIAQAWEGFTGLLLSPSRGLLIYSPITLLALPGAYQVYRRRACRDEQLMLAFLGAAITLFITYCFYRIWWAGFAFGPRFMVDLLPVLAYLIAQAWDWLLRLLNRPRYCLASAAALAASLGLSLFSNGVQVIGAFGEANWDAVPLSVDQRTDRLWDWRDSQLRREANNIYFQIVPPLPDRERYLAQWQGQLLTLTDEAATPLPTPLHLDIDQRLPLQAEVENTGLSPWFGYETGRTVGRTKLRVQFYPDESRTPVPLLNNYLYLRSVTTQNQSTSAIGLIQTPITPGSYRMVLDLVLEAPYNEVMAAYPLAYELPVIVVQKVYAHTITLPGPIPSSWPAAQTMQLPLTLKNTGNFTWDSEQTPPTFVAYHWLQADGSLAIQEGERTRLPTAVTPGATVPLTAQIVTPDRPGDYILQLTLVQENVAWFDQKGAQPLELPITIVK